MTSTLQTEIHWRVFCVTLARLTLFTQRLLLRIVITIIIRYWVCVCLCEFVVPNECAPTALGVAASFGHYEPTEKDDRAESTTENVISEWDRANASF